MAERGGVVRRALLDVWVDDLDMGQLMQRLEAGGGLVYTVNPDHLWHMRHNRAFLDAYRQADLITVDSHYIRLALLLQGRRVRHRLPGSDIVPAFCAWHADRPDTRVFLLGAKPGVAARAAEAINARVGRTLVVGAHGPSMNFVDDAAEVAQVLAMIRDSGANALFVGLGAPKQEIWMAQHRAALPGVRVLMGVGATIDYEAGEVRRAPAWMRACGLEWTYRVMTEPGRYLKRYVRSSVFAWWMLLDRLGLYRRQAPGTGTGTDSPAP